MAYKIHLYTVYLFRAYITQMIFKHPKRVAIEGPKKQSLAILLNYKDS